MLLILKKNNKVVEIILDPKVNKQTDMEGMETTPTIDSDIISGSNLTIGGLAQDVEKILIEDDIELTFKEDTETKCYENLTDESKQLIDSLAG